MDTSIVHIKDPQALLEQINNLSQLIQNVARTRESLTSISNEISSVWTSDTIDRESYLKNLNDALNKLSTLINSVMSLSSHLQNYAYGQIQNSI